jgi:uracil-DNA glycosylase
MSAEDYLPPRVRSVAGLRDAARGCQGCALFARATQTVFGEGKSRRPSIMLVGEQPGDAEDLSGEPFVGPAGGVLDRALEQVGLDRRELYLTNAVKHFKWEPRGKLRLHKNPSAREVAACRPWLMAEIAIVKPSVIVCLGATAARALLGPAVRVGKDRGTIVPGPDGTRVLVTVHPASIIRVRDAQERHRAHQQFVDDLRLAAEDGGEPFPTNRETPV